jgi:hypothetical protein
MMMTMSNYLHLVPRFRDEWRGVWWLSSAWRGGRFCPCVVTGQALPCRLVTGQASRFGREDSSVSLVSLRLGVVGPYVDGAPPSPVQ